MSNISQEEFKTTTMNPKSLKKHSVDDMLDKILEMTKEDPTVYTAGGNRSRLLIIRGNVTELKRRLSK